MAGVMRVIITKITPKWVYGRVEFNGDIVKFIARPSANSAILDSEFRLGRREFLRRIPAGFGLRLAFHKAIREVYDYRQDVSMNEPWWKKYLSDAQLYEQECHECGAC